MTSPTPGPKTILVIEDEATIREVVSRVLERVGFQVLCAEDATQASQTARSHEGPIHLLLSDINLPGLTGGEFAAFLKTLRPGLKVLYMSGAPQDPVAMLDLRNHTAGFIQKPFDLDHLVRTVRVALGELPPD
jgi:two-component system, cell cycle sensor histidine kinase and response regulator CckA